MEITNNVAVNQYQKVAAVKQESTQIDKSSTILTEKLLVGQDKVNLSSSSTVNHVTYSKDLSIQNLENDGYNQLRGLVANMLKEQGIDFQVAVGEGQLIDISEISQQEAQELVAEDGYFGVTQTSDRIVDFAIALSGNDPSRIDAIRQGVEKGFQEAQQAWGGELPEISYQTYDAIQEKLNQWVAEFSENKQETVG